MLSFSGRHRLEKSRGWNDAVYDREAPSEACFHSSSMQIYIRCPALRTLTSSQPYRHRISPRASLCGSKTILRRLLSEHETQLSEGGRDAGGRCLLREKPPTGLWKPAVQSPSQAGLGWACLVFTSEIFFPLVSRLTTAHLGRTFFLVL